jgi:hypothetical protein
MLYRLDSRAVNSRNIFANAPSAQDGDIHAKLDKRMTRAENGVAATKLDKRMTRAEKGVAATKLDIMYPGEGIVRSWEDW